MSDRKERARSAEPISVVFFLGAAGLTEVAQGPRCFLEVPCEERDQHAKVV